MDLILAFGILAATTSFASAACESCASEQNPTEFGYSLEEVGLLGTLVLPIVGKSECGRLMIFFPGHAQELGYRGEVPFAKERKWAEYLLGAGHYHLGPEIVKAGCPVLILGDSHKVLGAEELKKLLLRLSLDSFEVLAHSGGNVGLNASLLGWPPEVTRKIAAVKLLDNFYGEALAKTLVSKIDSVKLSQMCTGFLTEHNQARFTSAYVGICPKVVKKTDHKSPVAGYFAR